MNEKIFTEYLKCGLGRAVTFLRSADSEEREKYRAVVLDCCTHNYSYDVQSEGTRPVYKYELATCFDDPEYFIAAAIAALDKADDDIDWEFKSLVDLLCTFACNLYPELAKPALKNKYAAVYEQLINRPRKRTRRARVGYDAEHYENLCIALCEIDGMEGFIGVASDLGRLFGVSDFDADWFEWVLLFCEDKFGKEYVRERLEAASATDEYIAAYLTSVEQTVKPRILPSRDERAERSAKLVRRAEDERLQSALAFSQEKDEIKRLKYLMDCVDGFPLDPSPVLDCAKRGKRRLKSAALSALANTVAPEVRDHALWLIGNGRACKYDIPMLIRNYTAADEGALTYALNNGKFDHDDRHALCLDILEACESGRRLPFSALEYVYYGRCGICRCSAVKLMAERGELPVEFILECRHDADDELREYALSLDIS